MPLINGMKMACEPCIRGHRSTKCTHANERLMVPVRKPGRPLSACPHPRDQQCGCSSVTAAIPKKQACHCGSNTPASSTIETPQDSSSSDALSPTKVTFKVQKTSSRPPSRRKQSFDPTNFERMDMNSVNVLPFEQRPQGIPLPFANGYSMPGYPQPYGYVLQYASIQPQFDPILIQAPQHLPPSIAGKSNGFSKESPSGLENVIESPRATPTKFIGSDSNGESNGGSCCTPAMTVEATKGGLNRAANGGSCCAPKKSGHSHTSSSASSISEPPEIQGGSCCSSKPAPQIMEHESMSSQSTPNMTPQMSHQILPQNGMHAHPTLYTQYLPQNTVFTYPSTYGSFQNPLQPSAWRQGVRANSYGQPQMQHTPAPVPGPLLFDAALIPESLDTVHTCSCGDGCQCIGCAAHPYNDATQDYVRSAWSSMAVEQPSDMYANGHSNGNGHTVPPGGDAITSPTIHTPSSTTSGNGEEQSLSASDFFFVNYSFSSDGCGGDTQSCPCGDDCQCLGCTIHRQPPIPCEGDKDVCPCGDDCECIGCEIHSGSAKV